MTIQEVAISMKWARRPHWRGGYLIKCFDNNLFHTNETFTYGKPEHRFFKEDILATDWELVEILEEDAKYIESGISYQNEPLYKRVKK